MAYFSADCGSKGGRAMTYIENIFVCLAAPLLIAFLCMGKRYLRIFAFSISGMAASLFAAYINTFFAALYQVNVFYATVEITPVVEEIMKLLPLLFYLIIFEPSENDIKIAILMLSIGFATFENICYLIQNGADNFTFLLFRGFGTGAMHIINGAIIGYGMIFVWQRAWLKIAGTCGLLGCAVSFHAIYNLLVAYGGIVQYVAYAMPLMTMLLGERLLHWFTTDRIENI